MASCPAGHESTATDYCDVCGSPMGPIPDAPAPVVVSDAPAPAAAAAKTCPNCRAANPAAALFCEACGYDFTTGSRPRASVLDLDSPLTPVPAPPALDLDTPGEPAMPVVPESAPVVVPEPAAAAEAVAPELLVGAEDPTAIQDVVVVPEPVAVPTPDAGPARWVAEVWIDPDWYAGQSSPDQLPSPGLPRVIGLRKRTILIGRPSKSRGIVPDIDCEPDSGVSRRQGELSTDGTRWWVEDLGSANGTYVGQAVAPLPYTPITSRTELRDDARIYVGSWTRIVIRAATPDEADL